MRVVKRTFRFVRWGVDVCMNNARLTVSREVGKQDN